MKFLCKYAAVMAMCVAAAFGAKAEGTLSRAQIENAVANYTTLLPRYDKGESLSGADAAGVYYGAGVKPSTEYTSMQQAYDSGNMLQAHQLAMKGLKADPTNLMLLFKAYGSAMASSDADAKALCPKLLGRINSVCEAIFNSGLGVTESSPYLVTHQSDIEEFLTKYMRPTTVEGKAKLGDMDVYKVTFEGIADPVYLYFAMYK